MWEEEKKIARRGRGITSSLSAIRGEKTMPEGSKRSRGINTQKQSALIYIPPPICNDGNADSFLSQLLCWYKRFMIHVSKVTLE